MTLDVATMTTFRYGVTDSGQLIVQNARSRGGQAVIENSELDVDAGASTANIAAFRQVKGKVERVGRRHCAKHILISDNELQMAA